MKQKEIVRIVISIFILVVIYIGFSIYHNSVTSTITDALSIQIQPIAGSFDAQALDSIKKRVNIQPSLQNQIQPSISPKLSTTPTPQASIPSPTPTPSQANQNVATNSGQSIITP